MFASKDLMFGQQSGGYQISRSVRLRSSASAYFNRTLTTPTNNKIWTWSGWVKRGSLSNNSQGLFEAPSSGSTFASIYFTSGDIINWYDASGGATVYILQTTQVFRDPSAWYHIVCAYDSTQATAANRQKMYVNGVQITAFSTAIYVAQNTNGRINSAVSHKLGTFDASSNYLDGYLTEINFIDGQALTPTSFGATDAVTGVWNPIRYSGTYGTNGFYLNFSDNSGATATTIGKDSSGNGNNWTPNNISVTAGTTYDSMVDVPTNYGSDTGVGGELRGNYCTLNPLQADTNITLSNGNLYASSSSGTHGGKSTFQVSSNKWYFEAPTVDIVGSCAIGVSTDGWIISTDGYASANAWGVRFSNGALYNGSTSAQKYINGTGTSYGATFTTNDVIGVAVDAGAGTVVFYKNNSSQGTAFSGLSFSTGYSPTISVASSSSMVTNFGQSAFVYTAPSGFKALCTQNLPTPTISNGANYMAASLYTGTGASQTVSNAVNSISFQPDWVWIKSRSAAGSHSLYDVNRGVRDGLFTNVTSAENTEAAGYSMTAFNSNGFTVGLENAGSGSVNANGTTYVGWQWKGGGTAVTNTAGSITSSVSANTTAGFSVVTYTGNGTNGSTIGHGLGVAPKMIIVKSRSIADNWPVYHGSMPNTDAIRLNTTGAAVVAGFWNNTTPGASVFTVGGGTVSETNTTSATYVAYCFAPIAGFSAFGSYTGNGSTDGPFVYCGFRPRFVLWKRSDSTGSWYIQDTSRNPYNQATLSLYPNLSDAETSGDDMDYLSNGFKVRDTFSYINASGGTFLYAAFAENPFTIARAR